MSARVPVNPSPVAWAGNNPGIYLRDTPDGPWTSLGLYFDITWSPKGRGHVMVLLAEPDTAAGLPDVNNVCITDNQPMCEYLLEGFMRKFPSFLGKVGLDGMSWHDMDSVHVDDRLPGAHVTTMRAGDVEAVMRLEDLGTPFGVECTTENSATKAHEMYAVFMEARGASMSVNGQALRGRVTDRQFFGKTMSTAFLAISEIWVEPGAR